MCHVTADSYMCHLTTDSYACHLIADPYMCHLTTGSWTPKSLGQWNQWTPWGPMEAEGRLFFLEGVGGGDPHDKCQGVVGGAARPPTVSGSLGTYLPHFNA